MCHDRRAIHTVRKAGHPFVGLEVTQRETHRRAPLLPPAGTSCVRGGSPILARTSWRTCSPPTVPSRWRARGASAHRPCITISLSARLYCATASRTFSKGARPSRWRKVSARGHRASPGPGRDPRALPAATTAAASAMASAVASAVASAMEAAFDHPTCALFATSKKTNVLTLPPDRPPGVPAPRVPVLRRTARGGQDAPGTPRATGHSRDQLPPSSSFSKPSHQRFSNSSTRSL
jgi:hypothetical protein